MRTVVVGSSVSVQIPTLWEDKKYFVCNTSCDGLVYLYDVYKRLLSNIVFNPSVYRSFPQCSYQRASIERRVRKKKLPFVSLGFGQDKITGTYKPVWLYNSITDGQNVNATTCEVFDFATNTWRYIVPAPSHLILHSKQSVYVNGSLHWFTDEDVTIVLSLDLHTETFQVISKAPFLDAFYPTINMCNLDGCLCVSTTDWPNQVIWLFDSDHKTWKNLCSLDLINTGLPRFGRPLEDLTPLAVLVNDKLLLYDRRHGNALVTHDLKTNSYSLVYKSKLSPLGVCYYFPSLISIL